MKVTWDSTGETKSDQRWPILEISGQSLDFTTKKAQFAVENCLDPNLARLVCCIKIFVAETFQKSGEILAKFYQFVDAERPGAAKEINIHQGCETRYIQHGHDSGKK